MKDRLTLAYFTILLLALSVGPVFAAPPGIVAVPEPATMTLFGLGVGGAFIAKKFFDRK
jgi:PEP-CTERM motif-containing protein